MSHQKKSNNFNKNIKILITGGHSTPAAACIEELKERGYSNIVYVGQKKTILFDKNYSGEYKLIHHHYGIKFINILAGKLSNILDFNSIIWLLRFPIGFMHALIIIFWERPDIILTFGSHVGLPISFWGFIFRIPIIMHEQTTTIGRSNRLIHRFASKVCLSWPTELSDYKLDQESLSKKCVLTGNPVRKKFLLDMNVSSDNGNFNFSDNSKKTLFITGGNQGSHAINEFIFKNIYILTSKYNLIHQTGSNTIYNDFQKAINISSDVNKNGITYIPKDYLLSEEIYLSYKLSDLVISRSGANTISELILLEKKSILIPILTSSGDEQFKNALLLEKLGLSKVVLQNNLVSINDFLELIELVLNSNKIDINFIQDLKILIKNASKNIIDLLEEIANT